MGMGTGNEGIWELDSGFFFGGAPNFFVRMQLIYVKVGLVSVTGWRQEKIII